MKLVHVVRQFAPAIGGLENFVKSLALEQIKQGFEVKVVTLNRQFHQSGSRLADTETIDGISVVRIPYRGSYKYPIAPGVLPQIADADLIHVHGIDFFCDFLALTRIWHRKPMVLSTHGGFFHTSYASRFKTLFFHGITRFSVQAYQRLFACSDNDYRHFYKLGHNQLHLVENGVDTTKFANAGATECQPHMVFIGRFSQNKGILKLLAAFNNLKQQHPQWQLSLIGKDWDNQLQLIQQFITGHKLNNSVHLLIEASDQEIRDHLSKISYLASASEYEGFGLTVIEGMAAGLLPLVSAIPSFKAIVSQAKLGQIVDYQSPHQAAEQIANYHQHRLEGYPKARQAAITASSQYDWNQVAERFTSLYPKVGNQSHQIQGVKMDRRNGDELIAELDRHIDGNSQLQLAFANAHTINLSRRDNELKLILNNSLVINDGLGVHIASRWKYGSGFIENLNGTDFVPRYLQQSQRHLRVFLLGATEANVSRCFETWQQQYPRHSWVGYHHGFEPASQQTALCQQIKDSSANLVIVAMGNPLQERWLAHHLSDTGANIGIGVGALFDFTANAIPRAPNWIRSIRCEWLYRLLLEPRRMWRRYILGNLTFLYFTLRDKA